LQQDGTDGVTWWVAVGVRRFRKKGSTSAFAESILRTGGCYTGLFTSPHLVDIRERFRLRGEPISKEVFVKHFWTVWNALKVYPLPACPFAATLPRRQ
jgi:hypothetical protein